MTIKSSLLLLSSFLILGSIVTMTEASAGTYLLKDAYVGSEFLSGFTFETLADPTHGRVNYVDQEAALAKGLVSSSSDSFVMRADSTTKLTATGPGRDSIRIKSNSAYTQHVAVFDIKHMPQGCGTWPAAWETLEAGWPASGEVDILEGANDHGPNDMTLHTSANCTMPKNRAMTGTSTSNDCYWQDNSNTGCVVQANKANSYGPAFNTAGGGWYVLERTTTFIRVFFWSRGDPSVPADVKSNASVINTNGWGEPVALFPNTQCDINSHFGSNNIIFDLTFCGDWAGQQSLYSAAGCPGTCVDYVNNNPTAFKDAYWDIAAVRVYV
ncbi:laminarinase [Phellopilus nigrolimitatus]|nr:laminarinase [Phellopilus nigrolimitatus]